MQSVTDRQTHKQTHRHFDLKKESCQRAKFFENGFKCGKVSSLELREDGSLGEVGGLVGVYGLAIGALVILVIFLIA